MPSINAAIVGSIVIGCQPGSPRSRRLTKSDAKAEPTPGGPQLTERGDATDEATWTAIGPVHMPPPVLVGVMGRG